ncbi:MAG: DUF2934 domain-containing protein [Alphaproteobacteria bacterium]|nr:DUF2934 domain-containing protein [Alphaproteobacteria bacterium]
MKNYNEEYIRLAAYYNWQNAGCPCGKDEYFWNQAINQLYGSCSCSGSNKSSCSKSKKTSSSKSSTSSKTSTSSKSSSSTTSKKTSSK